MPKSHPKEIAIADYSYDLPEDRIAQHPLVERDASKLLILRDGEISETVFRRLPEALPENSLLIFNDTRVVQARLEFRRSTGGRVEVFCIDGAGMELVQLMTATGTCVIRALVGNAKKWKDEILRLPIQLGSHEGELRAENLGAEEDFYRVRLSWSPATANFSEVLEAAGRMPLPPYMKRDAAEEDRERYQTVFATHEGSVAAPTASLHFTPQLIDALHAKNIKSTRVTLHVGAGTFRPVKSATMEDHRMHHESIAVPRALVQQLIQQQKNIIPAGTTALRTVESLYWFGRKLLLQPGKFFPALEVSQWEPYDDGPEIPVPVALRALDDWARENDHAIIRGETGLLIAPGYDFKIADVLITNFHQPQSTLLLLVAAFIGEDFRKVYDYALAHDFRFLSYGDACLLFQKA